MHVSLENVVQVWKQIRKRVQSVLIPFFYLVKGYQISIAGEYLD